MTTATNNEKVHHGRNIKRLREMLGIKQEALAHSLGQEWSQHKVSRLEDKEVIEDEILQEVGKALHVTPEAIKNFDEQAALNIVSNTFNQNAFINSTGTFNINPIDRWLQALEENKKLHQDKIDLYERMLKEKTEMIEKLERLLQDGK